MRRLEISTFAPFLPPTSTEWIVVLRKNFLLWIYQSFHHLLQLQWSGNKCLVKTGLQPPQQALGKLWQKPSLKRVQLPVTQTNGAEKGQPISVLCKPCAWIFIWWGATDTYHNLWRERREQRGDGASVQATIAASVEHEANPRTTSRARLSSACWLPSSSIRNSYHPVTVQPYCWSRSIGAGWQLLLNCLTASTCYIWYSSSLSPALHPVCGTDRDWSPRRRQNSHSEASSRKMQIPSRDSSQLLSVRRCGCKGGGAAPPNLLGGPAVPISFCDARMCIQTN